MRKSDVDTELGRASTSSVVHALIDELTADELERVATTVIREHRCRLHKAQHLFEEIGRLEGADAKDGDMDRLQHDYRIGMLNLHAHHQLVSLVVNRLGYVPEVDGQRPVLN